MTEKEREVLALIAQGKKQTEIAILLGLTRQRVWSVMKSLEKKGILTRVEGGDTTIVLKAVE